MQPSADVVICGAGIAGISAAYFLSVEYGVKHVVLVDERPPLSLTSDKSTEAYRNWWPGPGNAMVALMNRSIDLLENLARQSNNRLNLNRRGYLYATATPARIDDFRRTAEAAAELGAGPVRVHSGSPTDPPYQPAPAHGFENQPTGADLITDKSLIRQQFPFLAEKTVAVVHARRCGWFSGYQLGMLLLEKARARGTQLIQGHVAGVRVAHNRVSAVQVEALAGGVQSIATGAFVNAAGPFIKQVGQMIGVDLPVFSELHLKIAFKDHLGVIPRHAPLVIWTDTQRLPWSEEERAFLAEDKGAQWLLNEFPGTVHFRPEGEGDSPIVLMLWPYHTAPREPTFPLPEDTDYPEIVLRGLTTMVPGLAAYLNRMPKPFVDGGYYTKTQENRPLIGPLPIEGAYIIGALSGFGLMAAAGAGNLLAAHITGGQLPLYAPAFQLSRYADPEYRRVLNHWGDSGQL